MARTPQIPLFCLLFLLGLLNACSPENQKPEPDPAPTLTPATPVSAIDTATIAVVGDLMCHSPQFKAARISADSFDFRPCFAEVLPLLKNADFSFGNLETTLTGAQARYSGYPRFNTPDDYALALKDAGFDLLSTSNNHSLDRDWKGVKRTIEVLNDLDIGYVGTHISPADQDSIRIYSIKGTPIAFLAYTYGTNGIPIPPGKEFCVNLIDTAQVRKDIRSAREAGAELVLVYYHYGQEYRLSPGYDQDTAVNAAIQSGADLVIGGHPHVIQPVDFFQTSGATLCEGFVAYSMGNFLSNQNKANTQTSLILEINIARDTLKDSVWIAGVDYTPVWVYRGTDPDGPGIHTIIPSERYADTTLCWDYCYTYKSLSEMKKAYQMTTTIIPKRSTRIRRKPVSEWADL